MNENTETPSPNEGDETPEPKRRERPDPSRRTRTFGRIPNRFVMRVTGADDADEGVRVAGPFASRSEAIRVAYILSSSPRDEFSTAVRPDSTIAIQPNSVDADWADVARRLQRADRIVRHSASSSRGLGVSQVKASRAATLASKSLVQLLNDEPRYRAIWASQLSSGAPTTGLSVYAVVEAVMDHQDIHAEAHRMRNARGRVVRALANEGMTEGTFRIIADAFDLDQAHRARIGRLLDTDMRDKSASRSDAGWAIRRK